MKTSVRVILCLLCAALILSAPFVISSPNMLEEVKQNMTDEMDREEELELDFSRLFVSAAYAEEDERTEEITEEVDLTEDSFPGGTVWTLPLDFTVPPLPNPSSYKENSYEDESIRVNIETIQKDGVTWHIARIWVASPTQVRTAVCNPKNLLSTKPAYVAKMAEINNAVIAINGDNYQDDPVKTTFEYRMTQKIRSKTNKAKDILIIDENGDFHLILADKKEIQSKELKEAAEGHTIVNAYTFGPALVKDGERLTINSSYGYNPNGKEPRAAIGQTGRLNYVMVIAEGRGDSAGVTQQQLADFMFDEAGCTQAFNLDGGNSAEMVFGEKEYKGQSSAPERALNDIFYFATAVPEENWR